MHVSVWHTYFQGVRVETIACTKFEEPTAAVATATAAPASGAETRALMIDYIVQQLLWSSYKIKFHGPTAAAAEQ